MPDPECLKQVETQFIIDFYAASAMRALTEPLWIDTLNAYRVPDTRSGLRKLYDRAHRKTIGRFRDWLHRDCFTDHGWRSPFVCGRSIFWWLGLTGVLARVKLRELALAPWKLWRFLSGRETEAALLEWRSAN